MIDKRQTEHTDRGQTHELDPPRYPQAHGRGQGRSWVKCMLLAHLSVTPYLALVVFLWMIYRSIGWGLIFGTAAPMLRK